MTTIPFAVFLAAAWPAWCGVAAPDVSIPRFQEGAIIHARKHIVDIGEASQPSINLKGEEGRREHWLLAPMLAWVEDLQGIASGS